MQLYPIRFTPILFEKVWGGQRLQTLLHKPSSSDRIGESWEISGVTDQESQVSNGIYQGIKLPELVVQFQEQLVGKRVYAQFGNQFPLLFKFIDAREDLSVQLHPDDQVAFQRHQSFGKTEMWYIFHADPGAELILGFNRPMDRELFKEYLTRNQLSQILYRQKVHAGDVFYIPPGCVHAIGGGIVLAEVQQSSDITYRVYDWDRPDIHGQMRELHTELALDVIDYQNSKENKINYSSATVSQLVQNQYFDTSLLRLQGSLQRDLSLIDSFVVYMCVDGAGKIQLGESFEEFRLGDTLLIPAAAQQLTLYAEQATLLEVYVP